MTRSNLASPATAQRIEGVVAIIEHQGRILVIQRAMGILAGGCWCFPGGAIEPGEAQPEAVAREVDEEVGLRVRAVRKVWEWDRPDGRLRLHWWLVDAGETAEPPRLRLNPAEVADARWLTIEEISRLSPLLESNLEFLKIYQSSPEAP